MHPLDEAILKTDPRKMYTVQSIKDHGLCPLFSTMTLHRKLKRSILEGNLFNIIYVPATRTGYDKKYIIGKDWIRYLKRLRDGDKYVVQNGRNGIKYGHK